MKNFGEGKLHEYCLCLLPDAVDRTASGTPTRPAALPPASPARRRRPGRRRSLAETVGAAGRANFVKVCTYVLPYCPLAVLRAARAARADVAWHRPAGEHTVVPIKPDMTVQDLLPIVARKLPMKTGTGMRGPWGPEDCGCPCRSRTHRCAAAPLPPRHTTGTEYQFALSEGDVERLRRTTRLLPPTTNVAALGVDALELQPSACPPHRAAL